MRELIFFIEKYFNLSEFHSLVQVVGSPPIIDEKDDIATEDNEAVVYSNMAQNFLLKWSFYR